MNIKVAAYVMAYLHYYNMDAQCTIEISMGQLLNISDILSQPAG